MKLENDYKKYNIIRNIRTEHNTVRINELC